MPSILLLATKNAKKVREMSEILAPVSELQLRSALDFPELPEPEEIGETFMENAIQKALYYSTHTGLPALADDSGLVVDALDGRPGVYSSRYGTSDANRIARLLREMAEVPDEKRTARFECAIALADETEIIGQTSGTLEGFISHEERGEHGFGYDPVFVATELGCHLAEAEPETKNRVSHRGRALQQMLPLLIKL